MNEKEKEKEFAECFKACDYNALRIEAKIEMEAYFNASKVFSEATREITNLAFLYMAKGDENTVKVLISSARDLLSLANDYEKEAEEYLKILNNEEN